MTAADMACPVCGTELTMAALFSSEEAVRAFTRLASVSIPLGSRVLAYCSLFTPPKTRLTVPKQVRLILQLLPDLERQAISHRSRDWAAPMVCWAQAIDQMLAARDAGRLDLPMKTHAYLYSILMGLADKLEAGAEVEALAASRTRRQSDPLATTVQVYGQAVPVGQALAQMLGARDPALAKLDADAARAAPMPDHVRAELAALRSGRTPS
jgi:hypothetical protein